MDYVEYLQYFNCYLAEYRGSLSGCVYMHNAEPGSIAGLRHPDLADLASLPLFAGDEVAVLRSFLTAQLAPVSGAQYADDFLHSKMAPAKQLLRHVPQAVTGHPQFTLLDEQRDAFSLVLQTVRARQARGR